VRRLPFYGVLYAISFLGALVIGALWASNADQEIAVVSSPCRPEVTAAPTATPTQVVCQLPTETSVFATPTTPFEEPSPTATMRRQEPPTATETEIVSTPTGRPPTIIPCEWGECYTASPTPTAKGTITPTPMPPTDEPTPTAVPPTKEPRKHCNKGEGNGGEDCDPGNHPDRGNDDEDDDQNGYYYPGRLT